MTILVVLWMIGSAIISWGTATIRAKEDKASFGNFLTWWWGGIIAWGMFGGILFIFIDRYAASRGYDLTGG